MEGHGLRVLRVHRAREDNNHPHVYITLQCLHCPLTSVILLITTVRWKLMLSSPFYRGNWGSWRQWNIPQVALESSKGGMWARGIVTQIHPSFHSPGGFLDKSVLEMGVERWEILGSQWRFFKQGHRLRMQGKRVWNWTSWPLGPLWVGRKPWCYTLMIPEPTWWGRRGWGGLPGESGV